MGDKTAAAQAVIAEFEAWRNDTVYRWSAFDAAVREYVFSLDKDEARTCYRALNAASFELREGRVASELFSALTRRVNYGGSDSHPVTRQRLSPRHGGR